MPDSVPIEEDDLRILLADYQVASALAVAADLGILNALASEPRTIHDLARSTGAHARSLFRLLRALVSVGVLRQLDDGAYAGTPLTPRLATAAPDAESIRVLPGGLPHEREAWEHLRHSILTGESAFRHLHGESSWDYHDRHPALGTGLHEAMSRGTRRWTASILAAYSFAGATWVVDVGGGRGTLLAAILQTYPHLRGILFDRPAVARDAASLQRDAGVAGRCAIVAGDFLTSVPTGGDLYLCKSVLHNWDDDAALRILEVCRLAMTSSSRLVLVEPVLEPGNSNQPAKLFMDLHMLVIHGSGERTAEEFSALCDAAGFRLIGIVPTAMMGSVIQAVPV